MKFLINGAFRKTGADVTLTIEAQDQKHAEDIASKQGILILSIEPLMGDKTDFQETKAGPKMGSDDGIGQGQAWPSSERKQKVRVEGMKTTSGFGIAALVLGIIACLTCWIPFLGLLVIPLGILGVVFGVIGILASAVGGRSYVGLPISGMVVSLVAVIIAVTITGAITGAASEAIDEVLSTRDFPERPSGDLSELDSTEVESLPIETVRERSLTEKVDKERERIREKQAYIQNVELYDVIAKYYTTYLDERTPGLKFKIKNKGNRTLTEVKVSVYFKDARGVVIAEEDFYPISSSSFSFESNKPLKPNYIWQMERGKFYKAESVPDEWKEGNIVTKITDIEFQE